MPFDPDTHRWLQLRGEDGLLRFETSVDGVEFETFESAEPPFSLQAVLPELGSGSIGPLDDPIVVSFEQTLLCTAPQGDVPR